MALRDLIARGFRHQDLEFVRGNRVTVLFDGGAFFRDFTQAVQASKSYVYVESYIVAADRTGWQVAKVLAERARAGVEVAFCFDGYGSLTLAQEYLDFLAEAGVKLLRYRPLSFSRRVWPWSRRNHRKILIVDGQVGIVGGMNISDDYAALEAGGQGWRDTAVKIVGPALCELESLFRSLWEKNGGEALECVRAPPPSFEEGELVRFLGNFARPRRAYIRRAYLRAIANAQQSIRICNAYFVPDRIIVRSLIKAARRGVRVELVLAGASDVRTAMYATRAYYGRLLRNGISIYEWRRRVLHAKTAVIDGQWCTIGSSNLDYLSSFRNLEVNAGILSEKVGREMDARFEVDRAQSVPIKKEDWKRRSLFQRIFEFFFYLLRRTY